MSRKKGTLAVLTGAALAVFLFSLAFLTLPADPAAAEVVTKSESWTVNRNDVLDKARSKRQKQISALYRKVRRYSSKAKKRTIRRAMLKRDCDIIKLNKSVAALNQIVLADETYDASDPVVVDLLDLNAKVRRLDTRAARYSRKARIPNRTSVVRNVVLWRDTLAGQSRQLKEKKPKKNDPIPEPTPEPTPTEEPTPEPTPTVEPTPDPTPTEEPTPEPTPTEEPTPEPTPTEEPTPEPTPTVEPTPDPTPTVEPTPEPTPTEEPTPEPTPTEEPTPEPEPTVVSVEDHGAVGDGVTDDTAAVTAAFAATAGSDTPVSFPEGTYVVSTLTVPADVTIVGAGTEQSWLKGRITLSGDTSVSDLKIGAVDSALRFADGAHDTLLERVYVFGGGSMTSGSHQGVIRFHEDRGAERITFRDCTIGANQRDGNGVSLVDRGYEGATYRDIVFEQCHFLGSPRMNVEIIQRPDGSHPVTTGYRNISFYDSVFEPSGSENVSYDGTILAGSSTMSRNTILGSGATTQYEWGQGVEFNGVTNMTFTGNTVYRCGGSMINHQGDPSVDSNNVFVDNVFDARVSHISEVPSPTAAAIHFKQVRGATFQDNTVITDVGGQVVYMSESPGNTFTGNVLKDTRAGDDAHQVLWLCDGSSENDFTSNTIHSDWSWGHVCVYSGSDHNIFTTNTFVLLGGRAFSVDSGLTIHTSGNIMQ